MNNRDQNPFLASHAWQSPAQVVGTPGLSKPRSDSEAKGTKGLISHLARLLTQPSLSFSSYSLSRPQCPIIWHQGWKGSRVGRSGDQAVFKTSLIQPFLRAAQPADRSTLTNLSTQGLAQAKQGLRVPYHWHLISYWLRAVSSLAEGGHRGHMKGTRRRAQQLALPWDSSRREQSCVFPLRFYALEQDLTQGTNWTPCVLHKYSSWYVVGVS